MNQDLRYPLAWPVGAKRTPASQRRSARFGGRVHAQTLGSQLRLLGEEMRMIGAREWLLSSNLRMRQDGLPYSQQARVEDPGIAVYFKLKGRDHSLACDRWATPEHNLRAIVLHIQALRAQERWGVGTLEQAFAGYAALPPAAQERPARAWHEVLGVPATAAREGVKQAWRQLVKQHHPDAGGSVEAFKEVQAAWEEYSRLSGVPA